MDDEGRLPLKAYSVGGVHGLQLDDWSGIGIARFDTRSAADEAARRWNAHDGLVEALGRAHTALATVYSTHPDTQPDRLDAPMSEEIESALSAAITARALIRSALKAAKGEA